MLRKFADMDKLLIDHLPIIAAIEEAALKSWDEIVSGNDRVWLDLYNEEIAEMNNFNELYNELLTK